MEYNTHLTQINANRSVYERKRSVNLLYLSFQLFILCAKVDQRYQTFFSTFWLLKKHYVYRVIFHINYLGWALLCEFRNLSFWGEIWTHSCFDKSYTKIEWRHKTVRKILSSSRGNRTHLKVYNSPKSDTVIARGASRVLLVYIGVADAIGVD